MAKIYTVTEMEATALLARLEMTAMRKANIGPREDSQMWQDAHRAFHLVCVRWLQELGFKGY